MENVTKLTGKHGPHKAMEGFSCAAHHIKKNHSLQLFMDCGGDPGPWLAIGLNETLYTFGWVPESYQQHHRSHK